MCWCGYGDRWRSVALYAAGRAAGAFALSAAAALRLARRRGGRFRRRRRRGHCSAASGFQRREQRQAPGWARVRRGAERKKRGDSATPPPPAQRRAHLARAVQCTAAGCCCMWTFHITAVHGGAARCAGSAPASHARRQTTVKTAFDTQTTTAYSCSSPWLRSWRGVRLALCGAVPMRLRLPKPALRHVRAGRRCRVRFRDWRSCACCACEPRCWARPSPRARQRCRSRAACLACAPLLSFDAPRVGGGQDAGARRRGGVVAGA